MSNFRPASLIRHLGACALLCSALLLPTSAAAQIEKDRLWSNEEAGLCIGCLRSVKEIAGWSRMDPAVRRDLMAELPARKDLLKGKRRGGRARRLDR